jgi:TolB-like protein
LVTGTVVRTADGVQVAAQLIDAADERQVWGQTFERPAGDLVALQNGDTTMRSRRRRRASR